VNRDDTGPGSEFAAPSRVADFRRDLRLADHVAVWKFIDYRSQPPLPPHEIDERVEIK